MFGPGYARGFCALRTPVLVLAALLTFALPAIADTAQAPAITLPPEGAPALIDLPASIQRVGAWPYGPAYGVEVDVVRDLIFLGSGGVVLTLDGTDPTAPTLISDDIHTYGRVEDLAYDPATQRLYVACGEGGLEIWDVAVATAPVVLSRTEVLYFGYETPVGNVDLHDHFAIVECEWGYVHSIDVADPTNPVDVSFNGTMGNPARDIHVSPDGQVHSSGAQRYQRLYIQPGGALNSSGSKDFDYGPYAVFGTDEVAYVGYGGYMFIIDLLHPAFPFWSYTDVGGVTDIVVEDGIAYILNGEGLHVWNTTVYNDPFYIGSAYFGSGSRKLTIAKGYAYVAAGHSGLRIIELGDGSQPTQVGSFDVLSVTWDTVLQGNLAYLAHSTDGLLILDLDNLTRPELIGQYPSFGETRDVSLDGNLAYVADWTGGLRIVDVSDPTAPAEIGVDDTVAAWRVLASAGLVHLIEGVANENDWLRIYDVSEPTQPNQIGVIELPGSVQALELMGDYLYLAARGQGVLIVSIADPENPIIVNSVPFGSAYEVKIRDGVLFVASIDTPNEGFFILSLADPENPAHVGHYSATGFSPFHVDISGDYAYLNDFADLQLFLIEDLTNPIHLEEYRMPGDLFAITAREECVFVSDGTTGLQTVENLLYETPGGGLQWEAQASGTTAHLLGVSFADAQHGWAVGDGGTIRATTDGGTLWAAQSSGTGAGLSSVDCIDPATAWAVGSGGTIRATTDGGQSWFPQSSGTGVLLSGVDFVDADTGWAVGDDGTIIRTTDGGATWLPQVSGSGTMLTGVSFADADHGWVTVGDFGTILRTTNGGALWQAISTGSVAILFDLHFSDTLHGTAVGMFSEMIRTTNGGLSWFPQATPHPPEWLYGVHFVDNAQGWAVGFDGMIIGTTDGGGAWEVQPSSTHSQLNGVHFVDGQHGWAVGQDGVIVRTLVGTATIEQETPETVGANPGFSLQPNHPNPFNPRTTIRYSVPAHEQVRLDVFSILGQHVRALVDGMQSPGLHRVEWDGRDARGRTVPSGIYFYRLQAGTEIATRKMILVE